MRVPVEVLAQIVGYVQMNVTIEELLALRLVSGVFSSEVLRVLPLSNQIHPRNIDKLLELGRLPRVPQATTERFSRYLKRQRPVAPAILPRKRHSSSRTTGHEYQDDGFRENDDERSNDTAGTAVARSLPPSLLKPYLVACMEDTEKWPCLLSIFIDRSVDLILEHKCGCTVSERQELFMDMVVAFNAELIGRHFADDIFSALFDTHGLYYWLPLYDAANLTTYPNAEHTLRLFHLFRLVRRSAQLRDCDAYATQQSLVIDILACPPTTPEYARLFAIDAFNLMMGCKNKHFLSAFLASETAKLLGNLTVPERIWCAAKQIEGELTAILLTKALMSHNVNIRETGEMVQLALLVIQGLVESRQGTHLGRTVVDQLVHLKDTRGVIELCRDLDLEDCTEIWHRGHAADLTMWR